MTAMINETLKQRMFHALAAVEGFELRDNGTLAVCFDTIHIIPGYEGTPTIRFYSVNSLVYESKTDPLLPSDTLIISGIDGRMTLNVE